MAVIEHPANPGVAQFPSIWNLAEIDALLSSDAITVTFEQFGLAAQKATTVAIVGAPLAHDLCRQALSRRCSHAYDAERLEGRRPDGAVKSSAAQTCPPSLCRAFARCMIGAAANQALPSAWASGGRRRRDDRDPNVAAEIECWRPCWTRRGRASTDGVWPTAASGVVPSTSTSKR